MFNSIGLKRLEELLDKLEKSPVEEAIKAQADWKAMKKLLKEGTKAVRTGKKEKRIKFCGLSLC